MPISNEPWGETTVLGHLVAKWRELGAAQIGVVTPPLNLAERGLGAPLAAELDRLGIGADDRIENPKPQLGMFSSVRCAAKWPGWRAGLTHWLLTLGDQPHVGTTTFRELLEFAGQHPDKVCQPARQGRPRHPVLLPGDVFRELVETPAADLKEFLLARAGNRACFESEDAGLDFDLDEPADYERARRMR